MIAATTLTHDLKPGTIGKVKVPSSPLDGGLPIRMRNVVIREMTDEYTPNGRRRFIVEPANMSGEWTLNTTTIYLDK